MDRMIKFDLLRAGPYACIRTGVWTSWTSVHNNKGKHWLFVVLLVWVYNKALINLEFGPYRKYLLWRHAARTSLRSVSTAWRHNKYFCIWTALSVNKSIIGFFNLFKEWKSYTIKNRKPINKHVTTPYTSSKCIQERSFVCAGFLQIFWDTLNRDQSCQPSLFWQEDSLFWRQSPCLPISREISLFLKIINFQT